MVVICSAYPSLSLSFASSIMTLFFIFVSLFFIDGINQKFISDFSVSIVTILISLSLIFFTIISTNEKGLFLQSISFFVPAGFRNSWNWHIGLGQGTIQT
ncbi:hypothetical protein ATX09_09095, partial [Oenococcus oeni]